MDYTAANHDLWNMIIQLGFIAGAVLLANLLRRQIPFIRKTLMPTAVLAGFILLAAEYLTPLKLDTELLEILVYHGIALGFIAMSLRVPPEKKPDDSSLTGFKSGAIIVSSYMIQAIAGLLVTLTLSYTFMPDLFKASGLLLPMGYGQGPGQANNIGSTYESLGFGGGRSFGLSIAAAGYLVACTVGVVILNIRARKTGRIKGSSEEQIPPVDYFQGKDEIPVSDSIDKLSIQLSIVFVVYLVAFLVSWGITSGISAVSEGLASTVNTLIWGFNFIIGSALAGLLRSLLEKGRKAGLIKRRYQSNFLLNRISGFFFDIMIVAGIAGIRPEEIRGLIVPFIILVIVGAAVTWAHLRIVCRHVYKGYSDEGFISMFGMMTGTISSGVLLLREIDPDLKTPAANNLVTGSSVGILIGAPILVLVGLAPRSVLMCWTTLILSAVYYTALMIVILKAGNKQAK